MLADDAQGLLLWVPAGADFACRVDADGEPMREAPLDQVGAAELSVRRWLHRDLLILMRPGAAHSVWWIFVDGSFDGWYVNMEHPGTRWAAEDASGVDTVDHALDVVVAPDRTWRWKDEEAFAAFTGQAGFWTAAQAARIRGEALRVGEQVEAGVFPFDGSLSDFRPAPSWPRPTLPAGWNRPTVLT